MKVGARVHKLHPYDGTAKAGQPQGTPLIVIDLRDQRPVDGPWQYGVIADLSDGTCEFIWNLQEILE